MTVDPAALAEFNAGTARARAGYDGRDAQLEFEQRRTEALMDACDRLRERRARLAEVVAIHQEAAIHGRARAMAEVDAMWAARTT